MGQNHDLRHLRLFLDFVEPAAGERGLDGRVHPPCGESVGHLGQALDLVLDGRGVATTGQFTQGVHLRRDGQVLLFVQEPLAVDVQRRLHGLQQPLRLDLLFAQGAGSLVVAGVVEGVLEHPRDLAVGQPIGRLDLDAGLDAGTQFACGHAEQAVGVDLEGHPDFRRARHHRRNAAQLEARQRTTILHQLALALQHVDHHGRLAVLVGGELLGARHRDGGIARNHLLHQPAHGFQAERQRNDVQQQQFLAALVAGQGIGLDGRADGDHLVRIDIGQRLAAEQLANRRAHTGHAGRATDHHHRADFFQIDTGVAHRSAAGLQAASDERLDQLVERRPAQLAAPVAVGDPDRRLVGKTLLGRTGDLQQLPLAARVQIGRKASLLDHPASDGMVEVVAAQGRIAAGGQDFEDTAGQAQDGNVEGSATQVVDGHQAFRALVQAVGHGGGGRLVEQAQDVQSCQARGILGSLALGVVEISRHGDHRTHQLATEGGFGALAQLTQDVRRDFHRTLQPLYGLDEGHVRLALAEAVGQLLAQLLDVLQAAPHQTLDRNDGIEGILRGGRAGALTHFRPLGVITHRGRQDQAPLRIRQGLSDAATHRGDQRIGGTQVDPNRQATLMGLGTLTGLGDLQ
ncbi:NAD-specific glutamate dehydrogenase [Pseudomonas aeruginosa P49]|nr:NAD-specific glutamate dehydrogenase [Pseudomonas aeruginosa P37]OPF47495.1 NAD-specific glutamate dehydrogenase [Pseudomonas aeruginosa P49]